MKRTLEAAREYKFRLKVGFILAIIGFAIGVVGYLTAEFGVIQSYHEHGFEAAISSIGFAIWHILTISEFAKQIGIGMGYDGREWATGQRFRMLFSGFFMAALFVMPLVAWVKSIKSDEVKV